MRIKRPLNFEGVDAIATPVSELIVADRDLRTLHDPTFEPDPSRVVALREQHPVRDDLVPMATMTRATTGGSLRTSFKPAATERGYWPCAVTGHVHHWDGITARAMLVRCTVEYRVTSIRTESIHLSDPERGGYTLDFVITLRDGQKLGIETKRDERDLDKPEYRAKLAWASEVFRRCGLRFGIVFRDEIFTSVTHRRNAELFASRGFVHVSRRATGRLDDLAERAGAESTYREVAETLGKGNITLGRNFVQALVVRRRLEMDLSRRLSDDTPVTIH